MVHKPDFYLMFLIRNLVYTMEELQTLLKQQDSEHLKKTVMYAYTSDYGALNIINFLISLDM